MRNRLRNRCCETWKNQNQHPKKTQLIDFTAKTWDTAVSFMQSFFNVLVERRLYVFSMLDRFCSQVANKGWWSMLPISSMQTRSHNPKNPWFVSDAKLHDPVFVSIISLHKNHPLLRSCRLMSDPNSDCLGWWSRLWRRSLEDLFGSSLRVILGKLNNKNSLWHQNVL